MGILCLMAWLCSARVQVLVRPVHRRRQLAPGLRLAALVRGHQHHLNGRPVRVLVGHPVARAGPRPGRPGRR